MYIKLRNLNINYLVEGHNDGNTILLLHGWGANIETFNPIIERLSKKFKVYALDLPGFGKSQKPPKEYTVEDYSKVVLEFINTLHLKNVTLIGHSFGGRVIIKLVGKLGYVPNKIVLVDSAGIRPKRNINYYIKVYLYKFVRKFSKYILGKEKSEELIKKYREKNGSEDYKNSDEVMREIFKKVVNEDLKKYLSNIKVPTLLMWGENDKDTPLEDAKKMEKNIPDVGLVILKGAGHYSYLNNFNQFIIILENFLQGGE